MDQGIRCSAAISGYVGHPSGQAGLQLPVGVLTGEGIGPEILELTLAVLKVFEDYRPWRFDFRFGGKIGKDAVKESGQPLTDEVAAFCQSIFARRGALLCGPGGMRFVYEMRRRFDLYCKLVPLQPTPALLDTGALRPEVLRDADILVVRENISGLYFGQSQLSGAAGAQVAQLAFQYTEPEIVRIVSVGAQAARLRRGKLCVVIKPGAMGCISDLWQQTAQLLVAERFPDVQLQFLEVDNASYQLVAQPRQFDVVVAANMFGDVLADGASVIIASRGMSYSANFGPGFAAVYQTGHGAAHDLAGRDVANPLGQVSSAAMMLHESFGLTDEALCLREAINAVLAAGWRTRDIMAPGCREVGTREMGARLCQALHERLSLDQRAVA